MTPLERSYVVLSSEILLRTQETKCRLLWTFYWTCSLSLSHIQLEFRKYHHSLFTILSKLRMQITRTGRALVWLHQFFPILPAVFCKPSIPRIRLPLGLQFVFDCWSHVNEKMLSLTSQYMDTNLLIKMESRIMVCMVYKYYTVKKHVPIFLCIPLWGSLFRSGHWSNF